MRDERARGRLAEGASKRSARSAPLGVILGLWAACALLALVLLSPAAGPFRVGVFLALSAVAAGLSMRLYVRSLSSLLAPVERIEQVFREVEHGNLRLRVDAATIGDPVLARLGAAANRLLAGMLADRQRMRDVAARAFRAQEAERMRIARELQEETAQTLTTVLFQLRAARQTSERDARDALLDEARDALMHTTDSLRQYARALHPPALKELGLVAALEGYARALSGNSGLHIEIVTDDVQSILTGEGELALYRIVQEALGNVARHAGATRVLVRLRNAGDHVRTLVEDNGRGFGLEETEARLPCLGLFGMKERALSVGGTVEIDSIPGDGTQVRISIPAARSVSAAPTAPWPIILPVERPGPMGGEGDGVHPAPLGGA